MSAVSQRKVMVLGYLLHSAPVLQGTPAQTRQNQVATIDAFYASIVGFRILERKPQTEIRSALHLEVAKLCGSATEKLALQPVEAPVGMNLPGDPGSDHR